MAEAGVANFEAWAWNGLAVPTGTPPAIVAKLSDACRKALAMPAVEKRLAELSVEAAPSSPEEFASFIKDETTKWHDVITKAGVSLQ